VFDLSKPTQAAFFAELMYIERMSDLLASSSSPFARYVNDDTPDLIAVSFASLAPMVDTYGRSSPEVVASLHVLDAAAPHLVHAISSAYDGKTMSELVLLSSHSSVSQTVDTRALYAQLGRLLPSHSPTENGRHLPERLPAGADQHHQQQRQ